MAQVIKPTSRDQFHIAIICALPREADAVMLLFDEFWDEDSDPFGRANGDTNTYNTGRIGKHNVVLAILPGMGTNNAASATASLRSSYSNLKLALLVGICGGVPRIADEDVFLGDVVVSKAIVQYDFGRQYPGGFEIKNTIEDSLGRANKDIRGLLAVFETEHMRDWLSTKSADYLKQLQEAAKRKRRRAKYQNPGAIQNKLFLRDYIHQHQLEQCETCNLGCDETQLVQRDVSFLDNGVFNIFIGRIGSGNTVMKSGKDRDRIAAQHNLIAFEMEGAGAWDEVPCLVVKGVCDYADSHKNKQWQDFAAATGACVMKAILARYVVAEGAQGSALTQTNGQSVQNNTRSISGNTFGNNVNISQGDMTWNMK
ncbi:phosphorylase superfamily domain-containing protein [Trichoderma breve]|uniref:Phosphorylase superfamily domain-containing protein n=1 Tax=Trichoderma breve TaxID=2034170 RepID=A0A9W9B664_9HYPO|nr:phosphorylase superfamily domain-containing protein [Trichoderma breve]KAJ4855339.1 phosphorylase superfamily domain-containing protein [Trichoderma breve]